jgi:hypothetical protein
MQHPDQLLQVHLQDTKDAIIFHSNVGGGYSEAEGQQRLEVLQQMARIYQDIAAQPTPGHKWAKAYDYEVWLYSYKSNLSEKGYSALALSSLESGLTKVIAIKQAYSPFADEQMAESAE